MQTEQTTSEAPDLTAEATQAPGEAAEGQAAEPQPAETQGEPGTPQAEAGAATEAATATAEPATDWQARYLTMAADFDNFRKRTNREKEQLVKFANESLLRGFVDVLDDLERALQAAQTAQDVAALRAGLEATARRFKDALAKQGIEEIAGTPGTPFDSEVHEAITSQPAAEGMASGAIAIEVKKGYRFQGRVLRPAQVITAE